MHQFPLLLDGHILSIHFTVQSLRQLVPTEHTPSYSLAALFMASLPKESKTYKFRYLTQCVGDIKYAARQMTKFKTITIDVYICLHTVWVKAVE